MIEYTVVELMDNKEEVMEITTHEKLVKVRSNRSVNSNRIERLSKAVFMGAAIMSVLCLGIIALFIIKEGSPALMEVGILDFMFGKVWQPEADVFGIFPMILATVYGTIGAMAIGIPIGVMTAVFIVEIAPRPVRLVLKPAIDLLAGIPSVVYGFFGLVVILPLISEIFGGSGNSLLAVCIILGIMVLPTIINISATSIRAVPKEYIDGSLALGASKIQTIFKVTLPAAKSGILASIILGVGRAIGETMAVILVAGNAAIMPSNILKPVRTMTANIAVEMAYAFGLHQEALFATGIILLAFIMILNITLISVTRKAGA